MADMLAAPEDLASLLERDDLDLFKTTMLVECGTAVVQAAAGQRIVLVEDDEIELFGGMGSYLALPETPVVSVASVAYNGAAVSAPAGYRLVGSRLWRSDGWADCAYEPIPTTVVYTHGRAPEDQKRQFARSAVLGLIRDVFDNPTGLKAESIDDYAATFSALSTHMDASPALKTSLRRQFGRKGGFVKVGG